MHESTEPNAGDRLVNLPPVRREPVVLPKARFEQLCSCVFLVACIVCFAWTIPHCLEEFHKGIYDGPDAGYFATALSFTSVFVALFWCRDLYYRWKECTAAEKEIAARPELAYRMSLPAARVAGDRRACQSRCVQWLPYADVGTPSVISIVFFLCSLLQSVSEQELAKSYAGLSAAVVLLIVAFRVARHLHAKFTSANVSAQEICVFCIPSSARVGFSYQGRLTLIESVGNRNANYPPWGSREQFLGGSQLIGSHQDPEDPTTPIASWELRLFGGTWDGCDFEVESIGVPVDCSKARDFGQWLSEEPARSMFGFVGKVAKSRAADNSCRFPDDYAGFVQRAPLPHEDSYQFGETLVLTAHISHLSSGLLGISLISLGGRFVLELQARHADRIVDFCHTVFTKVECASSQIEVVLPDGRCLNDMDGMSTLDTLNRCVSCDTQAVRA